MNGQKVWSETESQKKDPCHFLSAGVPILMVQDEIDSRLSFKNKPTWSKTVFPLIIIRDFGG